MLIRFVTNNFLSFDQEREFNMLAGDFRIHKEHVYNVGKLSVLKSAAIYGANGAGKSNLIKAIDFFQQMVKDGSVRKSVNEKKFKLNKSNLEKPIEFEIEFSLGEKIYAYGLSVNGSVVTQEWLVESGITKEDKIIFERETTLKSGKSKVTFAGAYSKTPKQKVLIELLEENLLEASDLVIGKTKELKIELLDSVRSYLEKKVVIIYPQSKFQNLTPTLSNSKRFTRFANDLLQCFDTGVSELSVENTDIHNFFGKEDEKIKDELIEITDSGKTVLYDHQGSLVLIAKKDGQYLVQKTISQHNDIDGKAVKFDLFEESDGTRRLLDIIPAFDGILQSDVTFIIDEIDQSLHPALLKTLIQKIMSDNSTQGQFIFSTHESNLLNLDIFRPDEIWFVEKDRKTGGSQLYSLSEFKPRNDLDIQKGYLKGRFGSIPFLASLNDLNWHNYDAEEKGV